MAFNQAQFDALESAIAQGVLIVQYRGPNGEQRHITYHSLPDMLRLRDSMRAELGISTPAPARSRFINPQTGKGL